MDNLKVEIREDLKGYRRPIQERSYFLGYFVALRCIEAAGTYCYRKKENGTSGAPKMGDVSRFHAVLVNQLTAWAQGLPGGYSCEGVRN